MHISVNVKTSFFKPFIAVVGYVYVYNQMEYIYISMLLYTFIKRSNCL